MPTQIAVKEQLSIQELSALYDRIYDIADRLIKKHNPCGICTKDNKTVCNFQIHKKDTDFFKYAVYDTEKLCCAHCNADRDKRKRYWANGCTIKCLGCKLFTCPAVENKILKKRFLTLIKYNRKHLSFIYHDGYDKWNYSIVDNYYVSKKDWLNKLEGK